MNKIVLLIILISPFQCKSQELPNFNFGIGFVIAENAYLYEDGSQPTDIYIDNELKIKIEGAVVEPFFMKPDYGLYHFVCIRESDKYYEVYINKNQKAFLPKNTDYYFQTWDAILINSSVQRLDKNNPIRTKSDVKGKLITNKCDIDILEVLDIIKKDGKYWLSIRFSNECDYNPDENTKMTYGWIEWRSEKELLVKILLLT